MHNRSRASFLLLALAGIAPAQPPGHRYPALSGVGPDDPHFDRLKKIEAALIAGYDGTAAVPEIGPIARIRGRAATALFPAWDFYEFTWSERLRPGREEDAKRTSLAFGLGKTVAIDDAGGVREFSHYGNYEEYGDFLKHTRTAIRDEAGARRVWDAFCEIHRRSWAGLPLEFVPPDGVHLGLYSNETGVGEKDGVPQMATDRYWYEIALDHDTRVVRTGRLKFSRSEPR